MTTSPTAAATGIRAIVSRASRIVRSRLGTLIRLTFAKAIALGTLLAVAIACREALREEQRLTGDADRQIALGAINVILILFATTGWSFISSLQRALIVSGSDDRPASRITNRLIKRKFESLLHVALLLAAIDIAVVLVGIVFLFGGLRLERLAAFVVLWYATAWTLSRGVLGVCVARAIFTNERSTTVISASSHMLRGHRCACVLTRLVPGALGAVASAIAIRQGELGAALLAVAVEPVVVTLDAALEIAWFDQLDPPIDARAVAQALT